MRGRILIAAAMLTFAVVVGCVVWPSGGLGSRTTAAEQPRPSTDVVNLRTEAMPYCGVAIQVQKPWRMPDFNKSLDAIAADGADTVSVVVDSRQENGSSTHIFMDLRTTPNSEQLADLINHAKSLKLRVVLMPIVLLENPRNGEWRGTIKPDVWDDWWESYRNMMLYYAKLAQRTNVDVLVVGSELVSTERFSDEWSTTIREVRHYFKGSLTYSANWDHYTSIPFWNQLDLIGMNSYYKLGENRDVKVEEIVRRWRDIQKDLFSFERRTGKPLILLEAGWASLANAAHEPWDYTQTSLAVDTELQRKLYEGFFTAWWGQPQCGGFMMWEWPLVDGGLDDKGYTPKGKPAEHVMKDWFAKPRWTVKP